MGNIQAKRADLAVLTIIPESFEAVRNVFDLQNFEEREGYAWAWSELDANEGKITVVAGLTLDRENVAAASFTSAMINAWEPYNLMLVDIGGAVQGRDDLQLGDVVVHTSLHYYDFKKETKGGNSSLRHLPHAAASTRLRELSRRPFLRQDKGWMGRISTNRPEEGEPKVLPGEMLVGGTLFSNSPQLKALLKEHPKVLAVEMEGAGVARGVLDFSPKGVPPEFLIVRGMSDFCNVPPRKNQQARDSWKEYACYSAAAHALDIAKGLSSTDPGGAPKCKPEKSLKDVKSNLWEEPKVELSGRTEETKCICRFFSSGASQSGQSQLKVLAVCGEAGIGKSALARTAVESLKDSFDLVWWLNGEDFYHIRSGLRELSSELRIEEADLGFGGEVEQQSFVFLRKLRERLDREVAGPRLLLVFDNVDEDSIRRNLSKEALVFLPSDCCCVLITSQSTAWREIATIEKLRGLDELSGARLISEEANLPALENDRFVRSMTNQFGGRPLFLKILATLIRDGFSPEVLEAEISSSKNMALADLPESSDFDPRWRAVYTLAISRADKTVPGSKSFAEVIACLSADPIPRKLLESVSKTELEAVSSWRAMNVLIERSLIEPALTMRDGVQMHRSISALIRTMARENGSETKILASTTSGILAAYPELASIGNQSHLELDSVVSSLKQISSHLQELVGYVVEVNAVECCSVTENAAKISEALGLYYWRSSEWEKLTDAYETSAKLSESLGDSDRAAIKRARLANVYRQIGRFPEAEEILTNVLPNLSSAANNMDLAWALTVQARVLRNKPDPEPELALSKLGEAYEKITDSEPGDNTAHKRLRSAINNYRSVIYRQLGDLGMAEAESRAGLIELVGEVDFAYFLEHTELPNDELIATHIRSLGNLFRSKGNLKLAMVALEKALKIFEKAYGTDHNDIVRALDSIGRIQRDWGARRKAISTFERARSLSTKLLGEFHAHVGTANANLALTYIEENDFDLALDYASAACRVYEHAYGGDGNAYDFRSEASAWAHFIKYEALSYAGDNQLVLDGHKAILDWRRKQYKGDHPLIASSLFAVAESMRRMSNECPSDEVIGIHEEALRIRVAVFGETPGFWVSQSLYILGILKNDLHHLRGALDYFEKNLAPNHQRTTRAKNAIDQVSANGSMQK